MNPRQAPIRYLTDPSISSQLQRHRNIFVQATNHGKLARLGQHQQMEGVTESFELAFRMQTETPKLVDMSDESQAVKQIYGIGEEPIDQFGHQCPLARRLVEAGVRFVQVSMKGWDHHRDI